MSKRITCLVLACAMLFVLLASTATAAESTSANEKEIYSFLTEELGLNTAAACGIMGNIYYETGFRANITVGSYFGLFMYYAPLGNALREWCDTHDLDHTTVRGQMEFFRALCNGDVKYYDYVSLYSTLLETDNTADGAYTAGSTFCRQFEKPANLSYEANKRGLYASGTLFPKYAETLKETTTATVGSVSENLPEGSYTGVVSTNVLNVRTGAGTGYRVISSLVRGESVTVTEEEYDGSGMRWCHIDGGWVAGPYITRESAATPASSSEATTAKNEVIGSYTVNASALNVRNAAGLSAAVINCLGRGSKVSVTEEKTESGLVWCRLSSGGWVCKNYLALESGSSSASSAVSSGESGGHIVTASGLNVRSGPGTSYQVVDCYSRGTRITIAETAFASDGSSWGRTSKGNWVCMTYVKAA